MEESHGNSGKEEHNLGISLFFIGVIVLVLIFLYVYHAVDWRNLLSELSSLFLHF